jgi:hypothetical protein
MHRPDALITPARTKSATFDIQFMGRNSSDF